MQTVTLHIDLYQNLVYYIITSRHSRIVNLVNKQAYMVEEAKQSDLILECLLNTFDWWPSLIFTYVLYNRSESPLSTLPMRTNLAAWGTTWDTVTGLGFTTAFNHSQNGNIGGRNFCDFLVKPQQHCGLQRGSGEAENGKIVRQETSTNKPLRWTKENDDDGRTVISQKGDSS